MKKIMGVMVILGLLCSLTACEGITININLNGMEVTPEESTDPAAALDITGLQEDASTGTQGTEAADDGLYEIWHRLIGYWNTNSEVYAVLDMADSHTAVFRYGWWETEFDSGEQIIRELTASGDEEMTAVLADGGVIVIDYSGLERDGKIRIQIGDQQWLQCAYGGSDAWEAYQTYCDNRNGM